MTEIRLVACLLAGTMAFPALAAAQDVPSLTDAPDAEPEIIVTAQKREERLIDVPQSVTAISSDDLARLNATQFRDFANTVPALSFTSEGAGRNQITIRGVTTGADVGPTVGVYVDDVPYGGSTAYSSAAQLGLDIGLFDVERIEVLRGPQGTLYGASALGGVLKYVMRAPETSRFGGTINGGLSFTRNDAVNYNASASVNAPLVSDVLAVRASAYYSREGGYIEDVVRGEDQIGRSNVYGGRIEMLFQPIEALTVRLTALAQDIDRAGTPTVDYTAAGRPVAGEFEQRRQQPEPFEQEFRLLSGTVAYDFGGITLTSITSYQTIDSAYTIDASPAYVPLLALFGIGNFSALLSVNERETDKFAQEVRLGSSGSGTFEWLIGGFYTNETSGNRQRLVPYELSGAVSPLNLGTVFLPSEYEEIAGFANVTVNISRKLSVGGGIRYARNEQVFAQLGSGLLIGSLPASTSSEEVVTYLANARYRFSDHAAVYARFATGFRPGGPNAVLFDPVTGNPLAPPAFDSDTLENFEIGFKAETVDRMFGIDLAAYHIDWHDIQLSTAVNGLAYIGNAGDAKVDGAELTLTARPSPTLTITGAFAYQNARLGDDAPDLGGVAGDRLPNVPEFTGAISADYRAPYGPMRPTAGVTLRFVSDRSASFDASPAFPQYNLGDYASVDLRVGATFGAFQAQAFVRNLFDERGQLSAFTANAAAGGPIQVTILQPRTIGISARARF